MKIPEKQLEQAKRWRESNPGYFKKYREANKERIATARRLQRERDPSYAAQYMRQYKAKDPDAYRARERAWYRKNKERLGMIRNKNNLLSIDREYNCKSCGKSGKGKAMHLCLATLDIFCGACSFKIRKEVAIDV
jgi:hypothetical protein